jgi:hypothetical protein
VTVVRVGFFDKKKGKNTGFNYCSWNCFAKGARRVIPLFGVGVYDDVTHKLKTESRR